MKNLNLDSYVKGWLVGDFEPNLVSSKDLEVAVKYYKSGQKETKHIHKIADEYTVVVFGKFLINGKEYLQGQIILIEPNEVADFSCLEDGATVVIKSPSIPNDKYSIE